MYLITNCSRENIKSIGTEQEKEMGRGRQTERGVFQSREQNLAALISYDLLDVIDLQM